MGKNDRLLGTLDLLVLTILRQGPEHGFGITTRVQETSEGLLDIEEGSLYPALHRMERAGWIAAEWRRTENSRRAKYYSLTKTGRGRLRQQREHWEKVTSGVSMVLQRT